MALIEIDKVILRDTQMIYEPGTLANSGEFLYGEIIGNYYYKPNNEQQIIVKVNTISETFYMDVVQFDNFISGEDVHFFKDLAINEFSRKAFQKTVNANDSITKNVIVYIKLHGEGYDIYDYNGDIIQQNAEIFECLFEDGKIMYVSANDRQNIVSFLI